MKINARGENDEENDVSAFSCVVVYDIYLTVWKWLSVLEEFQISDFRVWKKKTIFRARTRVVYVYRCIWRRRRRIHARTAFEIFNCRGLWCALDFYFSWAHTRAADFEFSLLSLSLFSLSLSRIKEFLIYGLLSEDYSELYYGRTHVPFFRFVDVRAAWKNNVEFYMFNCNGWCM